MPKRNKKKKTTTAMCEILRERVLKCVSVSAAIKKCTVLALGLPLKHHDGKKSAQSDALCRSR